MFFTAFCVKQITDNISVALDPVNMQAESEHSAENTLPGAIKATTNA